MNGPHGILLSLVPTLTLVAMIGCSVESEGPSSVEMTKVTLKIVKAAATEYEVQTGIMIDQNDRRWEVPQKRNAPSATPGSAIVDDSIERLVCALLEVEQSKKILQSLARDALRDTDGDGFLEVVDDWGNKLVYDTHVSHSDADKSDDYLPERNGPDPFVVSAGYDQDFGNAKTNPKDRIEDDNLYSFNLGE